MSEKRRKRDHSSEEKGFVPPKPPTPNPDDPSDSEGSFEPEGTDGQPQSNPKPKVGTTPKTHDKE